MTLPEGASALGAGQMTLGLQEPKFGAVAAAWEDYQAQRVEDDDLSHHTLTAYSQAMRYVVAELGERPMGEITRAEVQRAIDKIKRERGIATSRSCLARFKACWTWGQDEEKWTGHCPAVRIRMPRKKASKTPPLPEAASLRMAAICWDALLHPDRSKIVTKVHAGFFLVLQSTGLRRSEGTHLRRSEWDSTNRRLTITHHKAERTMGPKVLDAGKSAALVLDTLTELAWDDTFFFPSTRAKRGHIEDPWRAWRRLCDAASIPDGVTLHGIRHGYADTVYAQCGDIWAVKSALGHSKISTTQRYVSRTPQQMLMPTLDAASAALIGKPEGDER